MVLLVSGATVDVARTTPDRVGLLFVPGARNSPVPGRLSGIDNGAFTGFDAEAFMGLLHRLRGLSGCRFVVAPDVVGDADQTLALFEMWAPIIRALDYPVALAAQDGLRPGDVPWTQIDALFIGGTTDWKLSPAADLLLLHAGMRRVWRHVGRVNTRRRMRHFLYRCDSIDGSGFSRWPGRIERFNQWLTALEQQPQLSL